MIDIAAAVQRFFDRVADGSAEIYNEPSLQHELGVFLRVEAAQPLKVQFERPVGYFGLSKSTFVKNEIDLALFTADKSERAAIEVKFPRNGQYPEQMFSFCKDIAFVEQLVSAGFITGVFVVAVDDPRFYSGSQTGIYAPFRGGAPLHGRINKPTGKKDETVEIVGSCRIRWYDAKVVKYACVVATR